MEKKFKAHMVDVRGLSRKEAAKKRNLAYQQFMILRDMHEVYREESGKSKCKRKFHTSRSYVRDNMERI